MIFSDTTFIEFEGCLMLQEPDYDYPRQLNVKHLILRVVDDIFSN